MKGRNGLVIAAIGVTEMRIGHVIALGAIGTNGYVVAVSKLFDLADCPNKVASVLHLVVAAAIFYGILLLVVRSTGAYQRFAH